MAASRVLETVYRLLVLLFVAPLCAPAQSTCPQVNFLTARTVNLKPSPTTHIDVVRQPDGSYTGFEVTDAAPYRSVNATPHFEQQFAACLPHTLPTVPGIGTLPENPSGAGSQLQVSTDLPNGDVFVARISDNKVTIAFDIFDAEHRLLSETFPPLVSTGLGIVTQRYVALALADVNLDGKPELIVAFQMPDGSYGGFWIFPGSGDGTFQPGYRQVLPNVGQPLTVAAGDLNGDGKPDLVIGYAVGGTSGLVVVFGNGDGTFGPPRQSFTAPCGPQAVIADLNRDGKADLVLGLCTAQQVTNGVGVLLGNGDGTFQNPGYYSALMPLNAGVPFVPIAVGDVNGDGIPDIVTAGGSILFGDGAAGFPSRRDYPQNTAASVMLGDFDGDGKTDILFGSGNPALLSGSGTYQSATVLFGSGGGAFVGAEATVSGVTPPPAFNYQPPIAADFNGDGIPDIALVDASDGFIRVLLGHGNGSFRQSYTRGLAVGPAFAAAADFNRDGKVDLAVVVSTSSAAGEVQIFPGLGDGTLGAPYTVPVLSAHLTFVAAPDLNGDSIPDLVVTGDGMLYVWLGKGDGTFSSPVFVHQIDTDAVAFGDFNGDGTTDIAFAAGRGVTVLFGKGDGTFPTSSAVSVVDAPPQALLPNQLVAADFNGDGKMDLALEYSVMSFSQTAVMLGQGNGQFSLGSLLQGGTSGMFVADVNGDRIPDLIFGTARYGPLAVALGKGDGSFEQAVSVFAQSGWIAIADFDGNGTPDVAVVAGAGVAVLLNLSQPPAALTVVSAATFATGPLAPGEIATAFGQFGTGTGLTVSVAGQPASILYASPTQVNFLVPAGLNYAPATVTATTPAGNQLSGQVQIVPTAPALFTLGSGLAAAYAVQVAPDGAQTIQAVGSPIRLDQPGQTYLTLFGTGLGMATDGHVSAYVQGSGVPVTYAGPQPNSPGLDQINILLPASLAGTGTASIHVDASLGSGPFPVAVSNTVYVTIQ
jgi:uncharacterized protein (TIGR03437 family)